MKLVLSACSVLWVSDKHLAKCTLILPERRGAFFVGGALHPGYWHSRSAKANAGRGVKKNSVPESIRVNITSNQAQVGQRSSPQHPNKTIVLTFKVECVRSIWPLTLLLLLQDVLKQKHSLHIALLTVQEKHDCHALYFRWIQRSWCIWTLTVLFGLTQQPLCPLHLSEPKSKFWWEEEEHYDLSDNMTSSLFIRMTQQLLCFRLEAADPSDSTASRVFQ